MSRFIEIEENKTPEGAVVQTFTTQDGANLRAAFFPAPAPRGTIIVAPGWAEYIEKYFEVADDLRARRYNVAMMDWRGQGLSDAPTTWAGYFDQLADDLEVFREGPVAERFEGPYFLLTHSMGGLPALMLLARGYDGFLRAALCAPLTRLFAGAANAVNGALTAGVCMVGGSNAKVYRKLDDSRAFEGNKFTKDPVRHERFRLLQDAEPDATLLAPTYGWVRDAMRASKEIHGSGYFDSLRTPVKIISAGAEKVSDGSDHPNIAAMSPLIELETIDGALHEIMMEVDEYRDAFFEIMDGFFWRG